MPTPTDATVPGESRIAAVLEQAADAASDAFAAFVRSRPDGSSLRESGSRPGQYAFDVAVDAAVSGVLGGAGVGVLSEESGLHGAEGDVVVVLDPVDGSTNASRGIPWYACSLCALDERGPWVSLVVNLATGARYRAVRGAGASRDGASISTSDVTEASRAVVAFNGYPSRRFAWGQFRALGATALDICAVADGSLDATIDFTRDSLGPWDYMGALLVLTEAGGAMVDAFGRDLVVLDPDARRTPVAACGPALLDSALAARKDS